MITFERTASHGATNGEPLPFIMSLRLLDSKDTPITSQLAPFGQSYDVSYVQCHSISPTFFWTCRVRKQSCKLCGHFKNLSHLKRTERISAWNILAENWTERSLIGQASRWRKNRRICGWSWWNWWRMEDLFLKSEFLSKMGGISTIHWISL